MIEDFVSRMFNYDPDTGLFTWKPRKDKFGRPIAKTLNDSVAGYVGPDGYWQVEINNKSYKVHRLIWALMTGEHPTAQIDHINMDKADNRWCNLRLATNSQNQANRQVRADNRLRLKGVRTTKNGNRYTAQCAKRYLGTYDCPAAANMAFQIAQARVFGEYARPL